MSWVMGRMMAWLNKWLLIALQFMICIRGRVDCSFVRKNIRDLLLTSKLGRARDVDVSAPFPRCGVIIVWECLGARWYKEPNLESITVTEVAVVLFWKHCPELIDLSNLSTLVFVHERDNFSTINKIFQRFDMGSLNHLGRHSSQLKFPANLSLASLGHRI